MGRAKTEEETEGIEGRASEMLTAMEESSTWMEEATSDEMGNGNTLGLKVGLGRAVIDPLGRSVGIPVGRSVGRSVGNPLEKFVGKPLGKPPA